MAMTSKKSMGSADDRHLAHPHVKNAAEKSVDDSSDATNDLAPAGGMSLDGSTDDVIVPDTSEGADEGVGNTVPGEEDSDDETSFGLVFIEEGEAEDHDGDHNPDEAIGAAHFDT